MSNLARYEGSRVYQRGIGDVDGDHVVDGLPSKKKVYQIDPNEAMAGWYIFRSLLSWFKRRPLIATFSTLGVIFVVVPTVVVLFFATFRANPRYLTVGEAGGELQSAVNNFVVGTRQTVGVGLDAAHENKIAENIGKQNVKIGTTETRRRANVE